MSHWTRAATIAVGITATATTGVTTTAAETDVITTSGVTPPPGITLIQLALIATLAALAVTVTIATRRQLEQLRDAHKRQTSQLAEAHTEAATGQLTAIANRRSFDSELDQMLATATRHNIEVALLYLDLDHFKEVNDTYGHLVGDAALTVTAQLLDTTARRGGDRTFHLSRWGGEEFALLLWDTHLTAAEHLAEQARAAFAANPVLVNSDDTPQAHVPVTVSIGVATTATHPNREQLIAAADQALYAAKNAGRNRVVTAPTPNAVPR